MTFRKGDWITQNIPKGASMGNEILFLRGDPNEFNGVHSLLMNSKTYSNGGENVWCIYDDARKLSTLEVVIYNLEDLNV